MLGGLSQSVHLDGPALVHGSLELILGLGQDVESCVAIAVGSGIWAAENMLDYIGK